MRILYPLELETHAVALAHYPEIATQAFRNLQEQTYTELLPGENASNQLDRGIGWGILINGEFHWTDRETYSLSADLNPEEAGRVRRFRRLRAEFLESAVMQHVFLDVFRRMDFSESPSTRAYEIQLSAIRYEPTLEQPAFPSPVAPHQDLIDGAILVLNRTGPIIGGTSRIYALDRTPLYEFDLQVGEALLLRDARVLHQVTPILLAPDEHFRTGTRGYRDILIIRFQPVGR